MSQSTAVDAPSPSPPRSSIFSVPLIVMSVASGVGGVAFSSLNITLPRISTAFGIDVATVSWLPLLQSLLLPGLLLPFGWLGDRIGYKRLYIVGMACASIGSLGSAFAPGFAFLLLSRILVTIGISITTAIGGALAFSVVPPDRRGQALGIVVTAYYIGSSIGPTAGGFSMLLLDWRGPFLFTAPLLAIMVFAYLRWVPNDRRDARANPGGFDWPGSIFLMLSLSGILLLLTKGSSWGWTSVLSLATGTIGFVATALFILREWKATRPLLDLTLFRMRPFTFSAISVVFAYFGAWAPQFLAPFYLIDGRGFSTAEAGLIIGTLPILTMAFAPISGVLVDRINARVLTVSGMVCVSAGLLALAFEPNSVNILFVVVALGVIGTGIGLFSTPNNVVMMSTARPDQRGTVSAFNGTARNIGVGAGVAIASALYTSQLEVRGAEGIGDAVRFAFLVVGCLTTIGVVAAALIGKTRPE